MKRFPPLSILFFLLFLGLIYFPLFLHLDHMSLRLWDEARRAVNAFEMAQNGNWLVTHYAGQPEMWGTKPPLLIWCQAICMKVLGFNELAVRLPSALAGLGTIFVLILFSWKILKRPLVGFLAAIVLLTTRGYVSAHVARSGDFDTLLTLFEISYLLMFFVFVHETVAHKKWRWLYFTATFIALAGLTKGIAAFFFLPGMLLYLIWQKQLKAMLISKHFWRASLVAIVPIISFYLLREIYNPGYFETVLKNEVGGRYLETQGGHLHNWFIYFQLLWKERFMPWLLFLPLGIAVGLFRKDAFRQLVILFLLTLPLFFVIINTSQTRIVWYMAPTYPILVLLVSIGLETLFSGAKKHLNIQTIGKHYLLLTCFIIALFWQPYQSTIERIYFENHPTWDWTELKFRDFMRQVKDVKNYTIVHRRYNSHVHFYKEVYNLEGHQIKSQALVDFNQNKHQFGQGNLIFQPRDTLMICESKVFPVLGKVYDFQQIRKWDTCRLVLIKGKK